MKDELEVLQWIGFVFLILGHGLNAYGPKAHPYNIISFMIGSACFMIWSFIVFNMPQIAVNVVSIAIGIVGLVRARLTSGKTGAIIHT